MGVPRGERPVSLEKASEGLVGDSSLFFEGEERAEPLQRGVVASVENVCTVWISE